MTASQASSAPSATSSGTRLARPDSPNAIPRFGCSNLPTENAPMAAASGTGRDSCTVGVCAVTMSMKATETTDSALNTNGHRAAASATASMSSGIAGIW